MVSAKEVIVGIDMGGTSLRALVVNARNEILAIEKTPTNVALKPDALIRELAAMVVVNTVVRLLPGFLGSPESLITESHTDGLLEYPQYTRPPEFRNWAVPEVLLSGNHAQIAKWRKNQSIIRTKQRRPDMIERAS